jgi:hypothetical protein
MGGTLSAVLGIELDSLDGYLKDMSAKEKKRARKT